MIKLNHDVVDNGQVLLYKDKMYPIKAEEPSDKPGKVILVINSEIEGEEVLIETDIEE
ncbi:hypothetical protein [Ruminiclostridium papyrosolvens]|uniref:Uncharacterized protein n=1 Tax=Ruminiclostridium papyrosolvens C7 TaxID=1330534 RepID=U4QXZ0_9FIRM|nr:hypothetical protein [Ruminiclostridium papyrosolvens]EPR07777.1 hypothetical protein L323_19965 [Ruminiclostridium papyrosolvens C7]